MCTNRYLFIRTDRRLDLSAVRSSSQPPRAQTADPSWRHAASPSPVASQSTAPRNHGARQLSAASYSHGASQPVAASNTQGVFQRAQEEAPRNTCRKAIMACAGWRHTVLLRSDGRAVAFGNNSHLQSVIPEAHAGARYTQVAAGTRHTVLLRSDGQAVAFGCMSDGRCDLPPLEAGVSYTHVAAGSEHTVLLRSDGTVVACGHPGACGRLPRDRPPAGLRFTQVVAGKGWSAVLRSDGRVFTSGIPPMPKPSPEVHYVQLAARAWWCLGLQSDGRIATVGHGVYQGVDLWRAGVGLNIAQVAAGGWCTWLLTDTGRVVGCGDPADACLSGLADQVKTGATFTQISIGGHHAVLLCTDGTVVTLGPGMCGQRLVPDLLGHVQYCPSPPPSVFAVLLTHDHSAMHYTVHCRHWFTGELIDSWHIDAADLASPLLDAVSGRIGRHGFLLRLVMDDGEVITASHTWNHLFESWET